MYRMQKLGSISVSLNTVAFVWEVRIWAKLLISSWFIKLRKKECGWSAQVLLLSLCLLLSNPIKTRSNKLRPMFWLHVEIPQQISEFAHLQSQAKCRWGPGHSNPSSLFTGWGLQIKQKTLCRFLSPTSFCQLCGYQVVTLTLILPFVSHSSLYFPWFWLLFFFSVKRCIYYTLKTSRCVLR